MIKWLRDILLCLPLLCAVLPAAAATEYSARELDRLAAPIALYPDALLSQILMASTYPEEVAEAARWSREHPELSGDDAVAAAADENWEPSVQSLVAFPEVLATLDANPEWLAALGDAFLARPEAVMARIQYLRRKAYDSGRLTSNELQQITVVEEPLLEPDLQRMTYTNRTIVIEGARPDVIYVPTYDPLVVFAPWWWPAYPPVHFIRPPGYAVSLSFVNGIGFGLGIVVGHALWGYPDWRHRHLAIHVDRYRHFHRHAHFDPRHPHPRWQHVPSHRRAPPPIVRDRFEHRPPMAQPPQFRPRPAPPAAGHARDRDERPARRMESGSGPRGEARLERREGHERGTPERRPRQAGTDGYQRVRPPATAPGGRTVTTPDAGPALERRQYRPAAAPSTGGGSRSSARAPERIERPRAERNPDGERAFGSSRMHGERGGERHQPRGGFESRHGGRGER